VLGLGLTAAGAVLPARGALEAIAIALIAWGVGLAVAGVFILLDRNPLRKHLSDGR
jgi:hypothetical protein